MSLSFQPIEPVCVYDPRVMIEKHRTYAVLKSGSQCTWKAFTTTSISQSSLQFSCPPPSGNVIVDRKIYVYIPIRLTFTGIPANGQYLITNGRDAPRAFPIASSIDTLSATINNQSVNINIGDVIHALMHYNTDSDLKNGNYSTTPTYQDQAQNYGDLFGSTRNPLGAYADTPDGAEMARGGFPFTVVANPIGDGVSARTAIVDVAFCEPIFLPPFYFGKNNGCGFYNINTMDFNFTFISNIANRMWSHDDRSGSAVITSSTATFGGITGGPTTVFANNLGNQPAMLFQYITPQETMVLPTNMPITYPYFDIIRFPTDLSQSTTALPVTYNSNNIQLNSVPRRMYLYIRERNSDLQANASHTDTFFQINSISIQFLNSSGLLASASMSQLYQMSQANHCQQSWTQWSGGKVQVTGGPGFTVATYGTQGSVLCLEFATNIGLPSLMAPGVLSQCQLQVQVTATNVSGRTINPTLYIVPVLEGTFTVVSMGQCSTNIGVITPADILNCHQNGIVNYNDVQMVNGGDFWSGLKDFGSKLMGYIGKAHDFIKDNKLISTGLSAIPHPIAQGVGTAAKLFGYGEGGVLEGGRQLNRTEMRKRLLKH
jgi:hypothetical protein